MSDWVFSQPDGTTPKLDLPPGPWTWKGDRFKQDSDGNFRFVYDGRDCRAGQNCNAIVFEIPHSFITPKTDENRLVNDLQERYEVGVVNRMREQWEVLNDAKFAKDDPQKPLMDFAIIQT